MASLTQLDNELNKSLQEYQENVDAYIYSCEKGPCDENDLHEIAKYVFYTLYDFKKHILKYLKANSK